MQRGWPPLASCPSGEKHVQPACDIACSLVVTFSSLQDGASLAWEAARDLIRWDSARETRTGGRSHRALALTLIWQKTARIGKYYDTITLHSLTRRVPNSQHVTVLPSTQAAQQRGSHKLPSIPASSPSVMFDFNAIPRLSKAKKDKKKSIASQLGETKFPPFHYPIKGLLIKGLPAFQCHN